MEDWPYNGTDFHEDLDMPLLEGEDFDDGGKNKQFFIFDVFTIFETYVFMTLRFYECRCWNKRLAGMSPIARHVAPYQEGRDNGEEIMRNLEGLTCGILEYAQVGDIPHQYLRHRVGVSDRIHRLLTRVARAVSCYHDHHVD